MSNPAARKFLVLVVNGNQSFAVGANTCGGECCDVGACDCPDHEALDRVVDAASPAAGSELTYGYVYAPTGVAARAMRPAKVERLAWKGQW